MSKEELIQFNKPLSQNDISRVQNIIYPIFSKSHEKSDYYIKQIRNSLFSSMKEGKTNSFQRKVFWWYVKKTITKGAKKGIPLIKVEENLRKFIRRFVDPEKDRRFLAIETAKRNYELIKDFIKGDKILDLGGGDGLLALEIKERLEKEVILVDIIDYNFTEIPLILYDPEGEIPLDNSEADTTILFTVLHHSNDPKHLLEEAARITKKRLIIIEAYADEEHITISNSFFDWFYNRVIGDEDINVPLNFLKIKGWELLLKSLGYVINKTENLGFSEPLIPEQHVLIIADKNS